jgi:hypothetical protein
MNKKIHLALLMVAILLGSAEHITDLNDLAMPNNANMLKFYHG